MRLALNQKEWHLEIRRSSDGMPESTDTFVGTEIEAYDDAENWLREALSLDSYQKEILVIEKATETCFYQGTFGLLPGKVEESVQNYDEPELEDILYNDERRHR